MPKVVFDSWSPDIHLAWKVFVKNPFHRGACILLFTFQEFQDASIWNISKLNGHFILPFTLYPGRPHQVFIWERGLGGVLDMNVVSVFTWLPKASSCCLWRNNASIHFLSMVCQILDLCLKSCSSSSCDFNGVMLPFSSSFSSCTLLMSLLIFCSTFALFFLQISTLCLYPFWNSLSLSNSSYSVAFSFSLMANLFFKLLTSRFKFPIFKLTIAIV